MRLRVAGVAAVGHEEDEDGPLVALLLVPLGELTTCSTVGISDTIHKTHFKVGEDIKALSWKRISENVQGILLFFFIS